MDNLKFNKLIKILSDRINSISIPSQNIYESKDNIFNKIMFGLI